VMSYTELDLVLFFFLGIRLGEYKQVTRRGVSASGQEIRPTPPVPTYHAVLRSPRRVIGVLTRSRPVSEFIQSRSSSNEAAAVQAAEGAFYAFVTDPFIILQCCRLQNHISLRRIRKILAI